MHLVVPASGICGAIIDRGTYSRNLEHRNAVRLYLSSFSLTIGTENLKLQNIQRPSSVNVSMQITSLETCDKGAVVDWQGRFTPWARSIMVDDNTHNIQQRLDTNMLYVILKSNQDHLYPIYSGNITTRGECQIICIYDVKFDIPEYSAVSRTESPTINTFTLNGVADAREPVQIGPITEQRAKQILNFSPVSSGGSFWPLYGDRQKYAYLQTGEIRP